MQKMETRMLRIETKELTTLVQEAFEKKEDGQHTKAEVVDIGKSPPVFIETQPEGLDVAQTVDKGKRVVDPLEAP